MWVIKKKDNNGMEGLSRHDADTTSPIKHKRSFQFLGIKKKEVTVLFHSAHKCLST